MKNLRVVLDVLDMRHIRPSSGSVVSTGEAKRRLTRPTWRGGSAPRFARNSRPACLLRFSTTKRTFPIPSRPRQEPVSQAITAFVRQRLLPAPAPRYNDAGPEAADGNEACPSGSARQVGGRRPSGHARRAGYVGPAEPPVADLSAIPYMTRCWTRSGPKLYELNLSRGARLSHGSRGPSRPCCERDKTPMTAADRLRVSAGGLR